MRASGGAHQAHKRAWAVRASEGGWQGKGPSTLARATHLRTAEIMSNANVATRPGMYCRQAGKPALRGLQQAGLPAEVSSYSTGPAGSTV